MKKTLLTLALVALQSLALMAQNQYEMNVYSGSTRVFTLPTAQADSMTFGNASATINYGQQSWSHPTMEIDSIVFGPYTAPDAPSADTTAIDTTNAIRIEWTATGVNIVNNNTDVSITATGDDVSVVSTSSTSDLIYVLSGCSHNGSLEIASDKKLVLVLEGLSLTKAGQPVINMTSDKRVALHMAAGTINTLSDSASNSGKGTIQFKGKLDIQGSGTLNIGSVAKHAIQSSGKCNMLAGVVNVLTAAKDGVHTDDFVMDGGRLTISSLGDGIDGDKGYVEINNGTIVVNCTSADAKGISCDSIVVVNGGLIEVTCSGNQSKCIKSGQDIYINGGDITLNANGSVEMVEAGNGYDPSYCTGIKSNANIEMNGGKTTINCASTNAGGKGMNADGNVTLNNGLLNITAEGSCAPYTNEEGATDSYSSAGIKSNANIVVNGGIVSITAGGKAINVDSNFTQNGGQLTLRTTGNGAVTVGSGTNATDGYSSACIKAEQHITINAGTLMGQSTGVGGRGLVAAHFTVGTIGADDDLIDIDIFTSGAPVNASSNGGWGHGGNTADYWKGLPKGIKMDSTIVINSGHVSVYCSQTSGDPTGEAIESKGSIEINGGEVEANSQDDAINAAQSLIINGGKVWAYARGNDGMDCNGTSVTVNGGLVIAQGTEVGIDADTENGGRFNINGGTIVCKGGNMGCWDTPTCTGSQRYITANVTPTTGFAIADQDDNILLVFKSSTFTGSGFIDQTNGTGTKPPGGGGGPGGNNGGVGITFPGMVQGTYKVYSNVTIAGGSEWHGYYTGANCTTSGTATSATTR